jgi:hypothetical protein
LNLSFELQVFFCLFFQLYLSLYVPLQISNACLHGWSNLNRRFWSTNLNLDMHS